MTKREICNNNRTIATYGITNNIGIAIKYINNDVIYFTYGNCGIGKYQKNRIPQKQNI